MTTNSNSLQNTQPDTPRGDWLRARSNRRPTFLQSAALNPPVHPRRRPAHRGLLGLAAFAVLLGFVVSPMARADALTDALDMPGLIWTNYNDSGGGLWTVDTLTTHDGVDAVRTGTPPYVHVASLWTKLTGPGTVTFWAKASVQGGSIVQASFLGFAYRFLENNWHAFTYEVPAGSNVLSFVILNLDPTGTAGDVGWVDQVNLTNYAGLPPAFVEEPGDITVGEGYSTSARAVVVGGKPFTTYGLHNGVLVRGYAPWQPSEVYVGFNPATTNDAGTWQLVVSNAYGGIISTNFTLTVTSTPPHDLYITDSFESGMNPLPLATNAAVTLSISAPGTPPFTYQWKHAGTNLPGANGSSLDISSFTTAKTGNYTCIVSNNFGHAESAPRTLELSGALPVFTTHPQPRTLAAGDALTLWGQADGPLPLSYHWFKDGFPLSGQTSSSLYQWPTGRGDAGNYQLRATNGNGVAWSDRAPVTVMGAIPIGDAFDAPLLPWVTSDTCYNWLPGWCGQTSVTHDGVDAVQSEPLGGDSICERTLFTQISGPGSLAFWWKLEGAAADELRAEVLDAGDNVLAAVTRNGAEGPGWAATNVTLSADARSVRWTLSNGNSSDGVLPQAWLDELQVLTSNLTLDSALDAPGLLWSTGSQNPVSGNPVDGWFAQTNITWDHVDAAQSPPLQAGGSSWLQTTMSGPAVLEVRLFVSGDWDATLEFTLDGVPMPFGQVGGQPGPVTFWTSDFLIPPGSHVARWELHAGAQATSNAVAWLDQVSLYPGGYPGWPDLANALDNTNYAWLGYLWTENTNSSFTRGTAAKSPPTPDDAGAPLDTTVVGPVEFRFDWKVNAQSGDALIFQVDDLWDLAHPRERISGNSGPFQTVRVAIPPGMHFLRWMYLKDASGSAGADAGWIDHVVVTPLTNNHPPVAANDFVTNLTDQTIMSVHQLLLRNDSDPDWFSVLSLWSHDAATTNGGTVTWQGDWLTYTPVSGFRGRDEFGYTIADDWGELASAKVVILPENPRQIPPVGYQRLFFQAGVRPVVRFHGTPGLTYWIEGRDSLSTGNWQVVAARTAGPDGTIDAVDPAADPNRQRFYRTVRQ